MGVNSYTNRHPCKNENFTVSFSDGRALCYIVHHYHPGFLLAKFISFSLCYFITDFVSRLRISPCPSLMAELSATSYTTTTQDFCQQRIYTLRPHLLTWKTCRKTPSRIWRLVSMTAAISLQHSEVKHIFDHMTRLRVIYNSMY